MEHPRSWRSFPTSWSPSDDRVIGLSLPVSKYSLLPAVLLCVPIRVSPTVWIFYLTPLHLSFHFFIRWFIDSFTATADTRYVPGNIPEEQIKGNGHCPSVCRTWRNVEQTGEHLAVQRGGHKCQRLRDTRESFIHTVRAVQAWNHCLCTGEAEAREPWWVLGQPCWHGEFQTIQS